jgi:hypothetical protein
VYDNTPIALYQHWGVRSVGKPVPLLALDGWNVELAGGRTGKDKFKFQINLDRHNVRLRINFCLLDPPNFSLLSTFNILDFTFENLF